MLIIVYVLIVPLLTFNIAYHRVSNVRSSMSSWHEQLLLVYVLTLRSNILAVGTGPIGVACASCLVLLGRIGCMLDISTFGLWDYSIINEDVVHLLDV